MRNHRTHKKYWKDRKIDWNAHYTATWNHPHREMICNVLKELRGWGAVFEVGCASGPNQVKIAQHFPGADVGGCDVNPEAIETARKLFADSRRPAFFKVSDGENVLVSDEMCDVALSDMTLIYVSPWKIKQHLRELKRITKKHVLLVEFHSKNPIVRLWQHLRTGYYLHDYPKLLRGLDFHDIVLHKIPPHAWPGGGMQGKFGYIITAKK